MGVRVLPHPCGSLQYRDWNKISQHYPHFKDAYIHPPVNRGRVDMILGTDAADLMAAMEPDRVGDEWDPVLRRTKLGFSAMGVRSAGRYLKKEAGRAAIDTALEALDGKAVGAAAKKRLKSATRNILLAGKASRPAQASKRPVKRKNSTHAVGSGKRRKTKQKPLFYVEDDNDDDEDDY